MPINTLVYSQILQETLDKAAVREACTGWMDVNAGRVRYNGGNEIKIPKMNTPGLGDYNRDTGYPQGSVTLVWETRTMTQDRGRKFMLDAMDVDETNFVATAASVMGEFQRTEVIPEIDAYRLASIASQAISRNSVSNTSRINGSGSANFRIFVPRATPSTAAPRSARPEIGMSR